MNEPLFCTVEIDIFAVHKSSAVLHDKNSDEHLKWHHYDFMLKNNSLCVHFKKILYRLAITMSKGTKVNLIASTRHNINVICNEIPLLGRAITNPALLSCLCQCMYR